jgi:hypothetical protein
VYVRGIVHKELSSSGAEVAFNRNLSYEKKKTAHVFVMTHDKAN